MVLGQKPAVAAQSQLERGLRSQPIQEFCRRWAITELSVFGSALREDFSSESDVDILVTFAPDAVWSLWDHQVMAEELSERLDRKVDLVSRHAVEQSSNWIRRNAILKSAVPYYVA